MSAAIRELYLAQIESVKKAAVLYYEGVEDSPLTDEEYDDLVDTIAETGEMNNWSEHDDLVTKVAAGVIRGADTGIVRENEMLSLKKITTEAEALKFMETLPAGTKVCLEPKLDGFALSAHYKDGKLVSLTTRGDGGSGDDITANVVANTAIAYLPTKVATLAEFEVRGEVYITADDFEIANEARIANNSKPYTLERSAAAGAVRSLTSVKHVPLTYAIYDIFSDATEIGDSYSENISWAETLGFFPARNAYTPSEASMTVVQQVQDFSNKRPTMQEPTDGLVIKVDSMATRKKLGTGSRHPHWAVAFKYPTTVMRTVLRGIKRSIGRTGAVTYVAHFDTIELDGSKVARATVNNATFINALDLHIGDTIFVRKAKQIIPQVRGVVISERKANAVKYVAPTTCPTCEQEMDTTSSLIWRCDDPTCATLENLIYATSKDHLDVAGLSRGRVEMMFDAGLVATLTDFYKLSVDDIANTPTGRESDKTGEEFVIGQVVAKTIFDGLEKAKSQPLNRILSAVGVRHLGRSMSRDFAKNYSGIDEILALTVNDVANYMMKGRKIGESNAKRLISDLNRRRETFLELKELGFEALNAQAVTLSTETGKLDGEKIVVSGSVPGYSRTTIQEAIEAAGGVSASSVSSTVTFLVADEASASSKVVKAQKLGIRIVSPEDFAGML